MVTKLLGDGFELDLELCDGNDNFIDIIYREVLEGEGEEVKYGFVDGGCVSITELKSVVDALYAQRQMNRNDDLFYQSQEQ